VGLFVRGEITSEKLSPRCPGGVKQNVLAFAP